MARSQQTAGSPAPALLTPPAPRTPTPETGPPLTVVAQRARVSLGGHRRLPPVPQRPSGEDAAEPPPPAEPPNQPTTVPAQPADREQPAQEDLPKRLSPPELDSLAQQLLDPMLRRIRNELLLDRERRGRRGDWR